MFTSEKLCENLPAATLPHHLWAEIVIYLEFLVSSSWLGYLQTVSVSLTLLQWLLKMYFNAYG